MEIGSIKFCDTIYIHLKLNNHMIIQNEIKILVNIHSIMTLFQSLDLIFRRNFLVLVIDSNDIMHSFNCKIQTNLSRFDIYDKGTSYLIITKLTKCMITYY